MNWTVQFAVTAPVEYELPVQFPTGHVPPTDVAIVYPASGETVNAGLVPLLTTTVLTGAIERWPPPLAVTVTLVVKGASSSQPAKARHADTISILRYDIGH